MNSPLAITRCALLTPLDTADRSTWDAVQSGQRIKHRTTVHDGLLDPDTTLDRSIRLALAVARKVLPHDADENLHLFTGTSKGPITTWLAAADSLRRQKPLTESMAQHLMLGTGAVSAFLTHRLHLKGPAHTSVAACSSGIHALHRAAQALWRGECQRALVIAADASLHPLCPASFKRLGVLAPPDENGIPRCDPFNPKGEGFFLIEAAAALLLERKGFSSFTNSPMPPLAYLTNTWIGADATDLIAIDPTTSTLRYGLKKLLTEMHGTHGTAAEDPCFNPSRSLPNSPLAFIHAHATGTSHDIHELAALRALTSPSTPIFSHKKYLGHSLGAAGLVSVALSIACHQNRRTLEGLTLTTPNSLTIAQGFGGHIGIIALIAS